jgi:hypothetical protein
LVWTAVFAVLLAPAASRAVPLSTLFQGTSITAGNVEMTDWTFVNLQTADGGIADLDRIEVFPLTDDSLHPGVGFFAPNGALGTPASHMDASLVQLSFSFNARTVDGSPSIEGHSALINGYSFFARPAARVRIIENVKTPTGGLLDQLVAFAGPGDMQGSPNLLATSELFPRSALRLETTAVASGPLINDLVQLTRFELRFALTPPPVPEPTGMALMSALLLCAATSGTRSIRRRQ